MQAKYAYVELPAGSTIKRGDSVLFNRLKQSSDGRRYDDIVGSLYGSRPFLFFAVDVEGTEADSTIELGQYGRVIPFVTTQTLRLLDLSDPDTLTALSRSFGDPSKLLDVYRLKDGRVKRRSRYQPDMEVSKQICRMGFDGTAFLSGHGLPPEIVVCDPSSKVRLDADLFDLRYRSLPIAAPNMAREKLFHGVAANVRVPPQDPSDSSSGRPSIRSPTRPTYDADRRDRRNRTDRDAPSSPYSRSQAAATSGTVRTVRTVRRLFEADDPVPLPLFD